MKKLHVSRNLMIAAIVLIVAFQFYWLAKLYRDEYSSLKKEVDVAFRETIYKLQKNRFENDRFLFESSIKKDSVVLNLHPAKTAIAKISNNHKKNKSFSSIQINNSGSMDIDAIQKMDLSEMDASKIDCVKVFKRNMNIPLPPGLLEVFVKQKLRNDTGFVFKRDSNGRTIVTSISFEKGGFYSFTSSKKDSSDNSKKRKDTITTAGRSIRDSSYKFAVHFPTKIAMKIPNGEIKPEESSPILRFLTNSKSINDSIPVSVVDSAYKTELSKSNKKIHYDIILKKGTKDDIPKADVLKDSSKEFVTSNVLVGYNTPYSYQAKFSNIFGFIVQKMGWQISGSFLLLAFVVISFISLYRNLLAQRRLADMKNEFISNITHELKTPIATVSVAIEALKTFGGITSPEKTKEYLDISSSELQRLSLLVDKVLKLSMFENREIELKKEPLDLRKLVDEVLNTMKLQFEKHHTTVQLKTEGQNFIVGADRLHIVSVLYNLLDNAIKYSKENPVIDIELKRAGDEVILNVSDKGIGIPAAYKERVFEKFFRVPTGNRHNVKGYGLGLSYVFHVMSKHNGTISVQSEEGNGSIFTVKLPTA